MTEQVPVPVASHRGHRGSSKAKNTSRNSSLISLFCEGEDTKDSQKTTSIIYKGFCNGNGNGKAKEKARKKVKNAKAKIIANVSSNVKANVNSSSSNNSRRRNRERSRSLNLLPEIDGVRGIGVSENGEKDATPRELYAIGAVFDHLYRGGSPMNCISVFRKEVNRPRGNFGCGVGAFGGLGSYGCGIEGEGGVGGDDEEDEDDTYAAYTYNGEDDTYQTDTYAQKIMDDETLPTMDGDGSLATDNGNERNMYDLYTLAEVEDDPSLTSRETSNSNSNSNIASAKAVSPEEGRPSSPPLTWSSRRTRGILLRKKNNSNNNNSSSTRKSSLLKSAAATRAFSRKKSKKKVTILQSTKSGSKDNGNGKSNNNEDDKNDKNSSSISTNKKSHHRTKQQEEDGPKLVTTAGLLWHGFSFSDWNPPESSPVSFPSSRISSIASGSASPSPSSSPSSSPPRGVKAFLDDADNSVEGMIYDYDDHDISETEEAIERLRMWSEILVEAARENGPKVAAAALEGARAATEAATKAGATAVPQAYRMTNSQSHSSSTTCTTTGTATSSPPRNRRPHISSAEATEDLTKLVHMMRDTVADNIPEETKASTTALQDAVVRSFRKNLGAFLKVYDERYGELEDQDDYEDDQDSGDDDEDKDDRRSRRRRQPLNSLAMRMQHMAYKEPTRTYAVSEKNQVFPERMRKDHETNTVAGVGVGVPPLLNSSLSSSDASSPSIQIESLPPIKTRARSKVSHHHQAEASAPLPSTPKSSSRNHHHHHDFASVTPSARSSNTPSSSGTSVSVPNEGSEGVGHHRGDVNYVMEGEVPTTIRINSLSTVLTRDSSSMPRSSSNTGNGNGNASVVSHSFRRSRSLFRRKNSISENNNSNTISAPEPSTPTPRKNDLLPPVPPPRSSTMTTNRKAGGNSICSSTASLDNSSDWNNHHLSESIAATDQATVATPPKMTPSQSQSQLSNNNNNNGLIKRISSFRLKKVGSRQSASAFGTHNMRVIQQRSPTSTMDQRDLECTYISCDGVVAATAFCYHDGSIIDIDDESNVGNIEHNLLSRFNEAEELSVVDEVGSTGENINSNSSSNISTNHTINASNTSNKPPLPRPVNPPASVEVQPQLIGFEVQSIEV
mmetsp:Transcript_9056/g.26879  ORF Transcript_9056/g.26879 Transcript_9056/m.26879 type:complete len:1126 (+) Transcript_9056:2409-5786(+)